MHRRRIRGRVVRVINEHHLEMLAESGITPEHAELRGYQSVHDGNGMSLLANINIVKPGRRLPGLIIPMLRADGSTHGHQYRPDSPRLRDGKPVKYETPYQQRNGLDVPPGVGHMLDDPNIPLWITEGVKKVDCGALQGLCIVGLTGVWNWMTTSTAGGKVALPEFRDIALNGRRVIIAFDGDVARKESVQKAMRALSGYLAVKGAKVEYLHLPDTDNKTGLDDYLADHTIDDLWRLVKPTQPVPTQPKSDKPVEAAATKPAQPQHKPVDGAELLDAIDAFLSRFVVYPSDHYRHLHALWIAHTWLMECWDSTPRLAFLSPEPGSGKSRALEVTEPLVPRPVHAVNTTPAYLFRKVADPAGKPTILYDEIDTVFGPKAKDNEDIRGMLNAGHRKGAVAGRCAIRGKEVETEELDAYCAVALAGLDDLPDTIMTRSVVVRMQRRSASERVEPWRHRINAPEGAVLGEKLAVWADSVREHAIDYWPEMPDGVADRAADVAEALLSVADIAGGHWPVTSRVAVVAHVADLRDKEPSTGVRLLHDIHSYFSETGKCSAVASELITKLKGIEEGPWGTFDLDHRKLARRLAKYGIRSKNIRQPDGKVLKGYDRADFADAWERYLPSAGPFPDKSATSATSATSCRSSGCSEPLTQPESIAAGLCHECRLCGSAA